MVTCPGIFWCAYIPDDRPKWSVVRADEGIQNSPVGRRKLSKIPWKRDVCGRAGQARERSYHYRFASRSRLSPDGHVCSGSRDCFWCLSTTRYVHKMEAITQTHSSSSRHATGQILEDTPAPIKLVLVGSSWHLSRGRLCDPRRQVPLILTVS